MRFQNQQLAREALSEILAALMDRTWLAKFAMEELFGPDGSLSVFCANEAAEFCNLVEQTQAMHKAYTENTGNPKNTTDPNTIIYFRDKQHAREEAEDFELFWEGIIGLEHAMAPHRRYQYFVGNLKKSKEDLESEFELVESILSPESLWIYLSHITGEQGSCAITKKEGGSKLLESMDRKFWRRQYLDAEEAKYFEGEANEANKTSNRDRDEEPSITKAGTQLYSLREASDLLQTTPRLLERLGRKYGMRAPFSRTELEHLHSVGFKGVDRNATHKEEHVTEQNDEINKEDISREQNNSKGDTLNQQATDLNTIKTITERHASTQSHAMQTHASNVNRDDKWRLLKKFAAGAAVIAGAVIVGAIASYRLEEEEEEDPLSMNPLVPFNYAGTMPDGTPTFWGPKGGRYYRNSSGRKTYV